MKKVMSFLEFENINSPGLWDAEAIKKLQETSEPAQRAEVDLFPDRERTSDDYLPEPPQFELWQGTRFPQWM